ADHGHLRALTGLTNDALDLHDSIVDLGHLELEEPLHEDGVGTADDHLWVCAGIAPDLLHHGTQHVALSITILENLFASGQHQLGFVVDDEHLASARLIHFAHHDLADKLGVILVDVFLLDVADTLTERLSGRHHGAPAEVDDAHFAGYFVANLEVLIHLFCIVQLDLGNRILEIEVGHYFPNVNDLDVAVVGIEDDLKGVVCPVRLTNHGPIDVLDDQRQRIAIDAFLACNLRKRRNKCRALHTLEYLLVDQSFWRVHRQRPSPGKLDFRPDDVTHSDVNDLIVGYCDLNSFLVGVSQRTYHFRVAGFIRLCKMNSQYSAYILPKLARQGQRLVEARRGHIQVVLALDGVLHVKKELDVPADPRQ